MVSAGFSKAERKQEDGLESNSQAPMPQTNTSKLANEFFIVSLGAFQRAATRWMDLDGTMLNEISRRQIPCDFI